MSYQKASELLELAIELGAARSGLTMSQIDERWEGVEGKSARKNTQRALEALRRLFGDSLREAKDDDGRKRVHLQSAALRDLVGVRAEELAALDQAIAALDRANDLDASNSLKTMRRKLRLAIPAISQRQLEPDYEALLAARSLIVRPGPRPQIDDAIMACVTESILALKRLHFSYQTGDGRMRRTVHPLGIITGHRVYLVARLVGSHPDPSVWRVDRMADVTVSDEAAEVPESFQIREFAERSFGAFYNQHEYGENIWRFSAEAADHAREYRFHPAQTMVENQDGSITVKFHASGHLEMAWFLYCWGDQVEVLEPAAVRDLVHPYRRSDLDALP